jgi:hypothetical protein
MIPALTKEECDGIVEAVSSAFRAELKRIMATDPALDVSGGKGERVMCPLCDGAGLINSLPPVDTGKVLRRRGEASSPSPVAAPAGWRMVLEAAQTSLREALAPFRPMDSKARAEAALALVEAALSASPPLPGSGEGVDQ